MGLDSLLATLERRVADTPDTPCNRRKVSAKPPPIKACTLDTPDTPINANAENHARKVVADDTANSTPADERMEKVIGKLQADRGLRYSMETHIDADPEAVILSLAIRGKGACELRIPKSRYDAFALLELIEKHTRRETLQ